MDFEFDQWKSSQDEVKHGIDFIEAQVIWDDENALEYPGKSVGEKRYLVIGMICKDLYTACITYRGNRIRIISVRRATKDEGMQYDNNRRV